MTDAIVIGVLLTLLAVVLLFGAWLGRRAASAEMTVHSGPTRGETGSRPRRARRFGRR